MCLPFLRFVGETFSYTFYFFGVATVAKEKAIINV